MTSSSVEAVAFGRWTATERLRLSWSYRSPARKLCYNMATTAMTVVVATLVGTVYLAGLLVEHLHVAGWLAPYAAIGAHFEALGYVIVGFFVAAWLVAALTWRLDGFERRYGRSGA